MILFELLTEMTQADISWVQRNIDSLNNKRKEIVTKNGDTSQVDKLIQKHQIALDAINALFADPAVKNQLQTVKK